MTPKPGFYSAAVAASDNVPARRHISGGAEQFLKLPLVFKLTKTEGFAGWFVVSGDATADEIGVVWSVLGAVSWDQLPSQRALGHATFLLAATSPEVRRDPPNSRVLLVGTLLIRSDAPHWYHPAFRFGTAFTQHGQLLVG